MTVKFDTTYDREPAYTTHQAAEYIGRSSGHLRSLRARNTKPNFVKRGIAVFYKETDLLDYLAAVQNIETLVLRLHERVEAGRGHDGDRQWMERLCRENGMEAPSPGEKGDAS